MCDVWRKEGIERLILKSFGARMYRDWLGNKRALTLGRSMPCAYPSFIQCSNPTTEFKDFKMLSRISKRAVSPAGGALHKKARLHLVEEGNPRCIVDYSTEIDFDLD